MPSETRQAVEWALSQLDEDILTHHSLVHMVREYFNEHNVRYATFAFEDLAPYIQE